MTNPFAGDWGDNGTTISEDSSVVLSDGRGPFPGSLDLETNVLTVTFSSNEIVSGELGADGNSIQWNNNTTWQRSTDAQKLNDYHVLYNHFCHRTGLPDGFPQYILNQFPDDSHQSQLKTAIEELTA